MNGNNNQYDPTSMFKDWIQKSGQAQAEFIKNFGSLMTNQPNQTFNPLETLRDVSDKTQQTQSTLWITCHLCKQKVWILCLTLDKCFHLL